MSTQKTNIDGAPPQERQQQEGPEELSASGEIDLGIPLDGGPIAEDPSGYVSPHDPVEIAGRRVRPIANSDLAEMHSRVAGNVPMYSQPIQKDQLADSGHAPPTRGPMDNATASDRQQAQRLMPEFLQESGMTEQQQAPVHTDPNAPGANMFNRADQAPVQEGRAPEQEGESPYTDVPSGEMNFQGAAGALEFLLEQENDAWRRGDDEAVMQARQLREQLAEGHEVTRKVEAKPRHPAMQKLLSNLGLERILPTVIQWGGSNWMFAATNARLDRWAAEEMDSGRTNAVALMIASGVVGMDNVPVYEMLGIDLNVVYTICDNKGREETIKLKRFRRECSWGELLGVEDVVCSTCKRTHDLFDIPTDLRLHCAK